MISPKLNHQFIQRRGATVPENDAEKQAAEYAKAAEAAQKQASEVMEVQPDEISDESIAAQKKAAEQASVKDSANEDATAPFKAAQEQAAKPEAKQEGDKPVVTTAAPPPEGVEGKNPGGRHAGDEADKKDNRR